ncbi:IS200/IS605 family transposase [Paracoccus litorisediminis]|uniref:IS200/IS605 family transposase n=1 Tax=Paracoccus litorisediminis TaxID=2006130 RepID=UPI0037321739
MSRHHCRHALGYHFVFVTKRRKRIFRGKVEVALKRVLSEVALNCGYGLETTGVDGDHVHVFVSAPPSTAPGEIARRLNGASSRRMREIFPWIPESIPGGSLWSPSYFAGSVGAISEGAVRRYIAAQGAA